MLFFAFLVLHALVGCSHAQFIQRWTWQMVQDANGNMVAAPFWHRETNLPLRRVRIPQTDVIIEYNCHKLPAICRNVQNWENDASKSQWPRRQVGWFTVDFGAGATQRWPGYRKPPTRSNIRRDLQCPKSWKGTVVAPRCPETNQEDVVPAWVDAAGLPITAIVPQDTTNPLKAAYLEIMYKQTGNNALTRRRSGRVYSCDEFPPASWVEGGVGTPGQNNPEGDGGDGTTRCAPYGHRCAGKKVGSEQDWQGQGHILLNTRLKNHFVMHGLPKPTGNDAVAFRFRLLPAAQGAAQVQATRIYYIDAAGTQQHTGSGGFRRRSGEFVSLPSTNATAIEKLEFADKYSTADLVDMGWVYDDVIAATNDTDTMIHMSNGQVIPADDHVAVAAAVADTMTTTSSNPDFDKVFPDFAAMSPEPSLHNVSNSIKLGNVNSTLSGPNVSLSIISRLETQRQPKAGVIDIIRLSEEYILGQLVSNSSTNGTALSGNASIPTGGPSSRIRRSSHGHGHGVMHRHRLSEKRQTTTPVVEGPIQCGPGKPCLDGSCCNTDGKCGYKSHNCGEKCISNCNAKAMCGVDSADGQTECGLKLCCSYYGWCGTESVHCKDPEPQFGRTPCQAGYGSCEMKESPVCGAGSGTSKGRRVGYYQGWNTRDRKCDKVSPRQINTRGLTHLFYSFAFFNPTSFEIEPMNSGDISLYGEFTSLKRNGLQTWIAIGGWSFNDPGTTETAYSDMVSTQANRAAFINSLIRFMDLYGFQGADIDWEYPAEPKRGGRKADTDNLVLLMKEMHAAFGGRYGSSLTIAPDYWYLRGFKPADMQNYVDFLGFMSYDLHGPWDEDVKTLGSIVRPQTDITEIDKNMKPLWFDGVDPSKINFGIAYYGRTYKLSDPSCDKMGCRFIGGQGGAAGSCTAFLGVLSNREIRRIIKDEGITPYFNTTAMVKYFKYAGDSWVGYDDAETYALKEQYANNRCLGGIMIWSIDFDDETGGGIGLDNPNTFKSPESATIIPMSHTTVPAGQTFTLGSGASTDVPRLPNGGNQNSPQGPGADKCSQCSFFRRITSTCCGTGGSVANPILIPAGVPTPMDIPLPAGFTPNQSFRDASGNTVPANRPLPQETIIPRGTTFSQPFLIAPGTPLHEGEGDDQNSNSSSLVWLSPDIWNNPDPSVQCFFPCTLVLPPWPSFTSTIDYPRITVTESGSVKTTLTFPPLTVSRWEPETIVINNQGSCTTSCTDNDNRLRTSSVKISTTTTWPPVTYYDNGERKTTRPPPPGPEPTGGGGGGGGKPCLWPFCPGPPSPINLPRLTISNGPPKPTVTPCAFPALTCLPPGSNPSPPGGTGSPDPNTPVGPEPDDPDPEDEVDEEDLACAIDPDDPDAGGENGGDDEGRTTTTTFTPGGGTTTRVVTIFTTPPIVTPTTTTTVFVDPPKPKKTPDFSKDEVKCYDSGQVANRGKLISTADGWCKASKNKKLESKYYSGELRTAFNCCDTRDEVVPVEVKYSVEVHDGCEWKVDEATCKAEFRKIIDGCDRNTEARKQGGRLVGDCMTWRIDPNAA